MITKLTNIYTKVSSTISQEHIKCLSALIFPNDVLVAVKNHITQFAESKQLTSFVNHISDLY